MKTEKGQALILIAFGIVAILGLTALAIDGGNAFADRRHAQNAADNAALAAALTRLNSGDWQQAAFNLAADNTYDNDGVSNEVFVHNPPIEGPYACPAQHCSDYIQVIIESRVDTWFARIVGVDFVNNRVQAVARAKPPRAYFYGNAVVSLSPGDGKSNTHEFIYGGSSDVVVMGSGIFVNADDGACPVTNTGAAVSLEITDGGITTVGSCAGAESATQIAYPPSFPEFEDLCSRPNAVPVSGNFPKNNTPEQLPNDTIYCISGDFKVTSNNTVLNGAGVTFVVLGDVEIQGGQLNLASPPDLPLFYLPYADTRFNNAGNPTSVVKINGNSNLSLKGMVLAPATPCDINGASGTGLHGQLVCYEVTLTGGSDATVVYNDADNPDEPPHVELTQ
jgi:hypothetical protein